jgi:hypothetical protein
MRTTLDIEDDVLQAAKELAAREKSTAGAVLSQLARKGLCAASGVAETPNAYQVRHGVPVFPARKGELITLDHVARLADEEGV